MKSEIELVGGPADGHRMFVPEDPPPPVWRVPMLAEPPYCGPMPNPHDPVLIHEILYRRRRRPRGGVWYFDAEGPLC